MVSIEVPLENPKTERMRTEGFFSHDLGNLHRYGSVSKPCTPGEHQNSW